MSTPEDVERKRLEDQERARQQGQTGTGVPGSTTKTLHKSGYDPDADDNPGEPAQPRVPMEDGAMPTGETKRGKPGKGKEQAKENAEKAP